MKQTGCNKNFSSQTLFNAQLKALFYRKRIPVAAKEGAAPSIQRKFKPHGAGATPRSDPLNNKKNFSEIPFVSSGITAVISGIIPNKEPQSGIHVAKSYQIIVFYIVFLRAREAYTPPLQLTISNFDSYIFKICSSIIRIWAIYVTVLGRFM